MRAKETFQQQYRREFDDGLAAIYMKHHGNDAGMLEDRPQPRPSLLVRSAVIQALNFAAWARRYDSTGATEGSEA